MTAASKSATMPAVYYDAFQGPIRIQDVPVPELSPGSVVIQVKATGLCRSDWHGWMGHDSDIQLPHVPGHELSGVVDQVADDVMHWTPGDRVIVPFACGCGQCPPCIRRQLHICDHYFQPGFTAWGSFAPLVRIDFADHNLVRLPDAFDFITGASLGCRFATAYRAVMLQGQLRPGQWLAVFGCGGVGLSAVMIGVAQGARAIAIDTNAQALRLASQLGAELVINANKTRDVERFIMNCTGGGADVSIDALGHAETCCQSILSLRKQGRHVQVGLLLGDQSRPRIPMERVIGWELQLLGSHGLAAPDYAPLLQLIEAGTIMPQQLVTQTIALEQAPNQLAQMGRFPFAGVTVIDRFA